MCTKRPTTETRSMDEAQDTAQKMFQHLGENARFIVIADTENTVVNMAYAEKVIDAFRKLTGWVVAYGTQIHDDLVRFSLLYSREDRNVFEVAVIFLTVNDLLKLFLN
jgi:hypothetical protein